MGIIWGWLGTPRDDRHVRAMIKPIIDEDSCYKDIVLVKKAAGVAIVHVIQSSVKSYKNRCINSCCLEFPLPWVGLSLPQALVAARGLGRWAVPQLQRFHCLKILKNLLFQKRSYRLKLKIFLLCYPK